MTDARYLTASVHPANNGGRPFFWLRPMEEEIFIATDYDPHARRIPEFFRKRKVFRTVYPWLNYILGRPDIQLQNSRKIGRDGEVLITRNGGRQRLAVMSRIKQIRRAVLEELLEQNRIMRELLESWPARKIMMDYEKEWNEGREDFLNNHPPLDIGV